MAIYKTDSGDFAISANQCWRPGSYEDERTAKYAFRFSDADLKELQSSVNPGGTITFKMLQDKAQRNKKTNMGHNEKPNSND